MRGYILLVFFLQFNLLLGQYQLSGFIQDESTRLPGVQVWIHETGLGCITDSTGYFKLTNIKKGHYHLHIDLESYQSFQQNIQIHSDTSIIITLKPTSIEIKQVVIESDLLKTSRTESSLNMDALSTNDLVKLPNQNIVQALERIPGIRNMNVGVGIAKPVIRGFSMNRVVVAENGLKQEGQQWGQDHGLELDSWSVDQVEIIKGPATLLYGSDAMGGVIHLKSKWIANNTLDSRLTLGYRSVNGNPFSAFRVGLTKNGWMFQTLASYQIWKAFSIPADSFIYNDFRFSIPNNQLKNTGGKEESYGLRTGIRKNWGSILCTASLYNQYSGFFAGAFGIPSSYDLIPTGKPYEILLPSQKVNHAKLQLQAKILLGHDWLEMEMGWQRNLRREFSNPHSQASTANSNLALQLNLQTYAANIRYNRIFENGIKWISGVSAQLQQNNAQGFEFLLAEFKRNQAGIFSWLQKDWKQKCFINLGLRYDWSDIQSDGFIQTYANGQTWTRVQPLTKSYSSPSAALGLSWFPLKEWNIKWNLASDFKFPAPNELLTNGIHHGSFRHELGNPLLKTERGYQTDFSIACSQQNWDFQLTPFGSWIKNYIYLTPGARFSTLKEGGQIYEYRQADALMSGAELRTEWHSMEWLHLGIQADYVYGKNLNTTLALPFIPQPSTTFQVELAKDSLLVFHTLFFNFELKKLFNQNRTDKNEKKTPGSLVLNLSTGFQWKIKNQNLMFVLQVQNLLNTAWYSHISRYRILELPEPGRNISISLNIPFNKKLKD